ncbi:IS1182 family transposase [Candidatus Formimonas warabiya]|nr:IS1182 family transposase [Candidatus Formimonas warabiya]
MQLSLSPYQGLYDIVVPQEHLLRKIKEHIDFSFVNPMLRKQYCENFGRPAKEPEMMFKLMFLKKMYDLSDEKLISGAQTDMAYKYFLDLDPEAEMIDPSLLTKFRKTRITEDILEDMLRETIRQGIEKGIIKSTAIIVDSTHTNSAARPKTVTQVLRELSKQFRRKIYREMIELSEKFPEKPSETAELAEEIEYTYHLLENVKEDILQSEKISLIELYERIKELLDTQRIREIRSKNDEDARFGHKTATSTFFGYKSHLAMSEERIITGIEVTHGGEADCKQLPALLEKSQNNGVEVKEIIGDMAYVSEDNLDTCEEDGVMLFAKTNSAVAAAAASSLDEGFSFNKDAGLLQCPAGELAMRVEKRAAENGNTYLRYVFSKVKCRKCPLWEQCRVGKSKAKERSYSITQPNEKNRLRLEFEAGEYFRERLKIRHRIEEKNGEMKVAHGLGKADSVGLDAMRLQTYFTAFVVNVKRIVKLSALNPA